MIKMILNSVKPWHGSKEIEQMKKNLLKKTWWNLVKIVMAYVLDSSPYSQDPTHPHGNQHRLLQPRTPGFVPNSWLEGQLPRMDSVSVSHPDPAACWRINAWCAQLTTGSFSPSSYSRCQLYLEYRATDNNEAPLELKKTWYHRLFFYYMHLLPKACKIQKSSPALILNSRDLTLRFYLWANWLVYVFY